MTEISESGFTLLFNAQNCSLVILINENFQNLRSHFSCKIFHSCVDYPDNFLSLFSNCGKKSNIFVTLQQISRYKHTAFLTHNWGKIGVKPQPGTLLAHAFEAKTP